MARPSPEAQLLEVLRAHPLYAKVAGVLRSHVGQEDRLLVVAVSAGGDSTALALLVTAWAVVRQRMVVLAYFDHEVDPQRHLREWEGVVSLATRLGVPAAKGSAAMFAHLRGRGPEETWRKRRYAFLDLLAGTSGLVLSGHTLDDAAETFLMGAIRGGSGGAMAGPRTLGPRLVRPLRGIRRETLRDLLVALGVPWVEDPTNTNRSFRSVIRSEVIPTILRHVGPYALEGLARSASLVEEWNEAIEAASDAAAREAVSVRHGEAFLDLRVLGGYPRAVRRRVLRRVLASMGDASSGAADRLLRLCEGGRAGRLDLAGHLVAVRSGSVVRLARETQTSRMEEVPLPLPGMVRFGGWTLFASLRWGTAHAVHLPAQGAVAVLDRDAVREPLYVRPRSRGDAFVPMGMSGRVKVKKYLRDHAVPRWQRWAIPIVCDAASRILWIPGVGRAREALVRPGTRRLIVLRVVRAGKEEPSGG